MNRDPLNLIIAGVGGQGNVLASHILATAGIEDGFFITVSETYGASQRGGAVMSHVRLSRKAQCGPLTPQGGADIVVGLEPVETLRVIADYGNANTRVVVSARPIYPIWVLSGQVEYPDVEEMVARLRRLAASVEVVREGENEEGARVANVLMLGALAGTGALPIRTQSLEHAIKRILPAADVAVNLNAFRKGVAATERGVTAP